MAKHRIWLWVEAVEINSRVQGGVQSWHGFRTIIHRLMEASSKERIMEVVVAKRWKLIVEYKAEYKAGTNSVQENKV